MICRYFPRKKSKSEPTGIYLMLNADSQERRLNPSVFLRMDKPSEIYIYSNLKTHLISFCETAERYPTFLFTMFHSVSSPS